MRIYSLYKTSIIFTDTATQIINKHRLVMNENGIKNNHNFTDSVNDIVENQN